MRKQKKSLEDDPLAEDRSEDIRGMKFQKVRFVFAPKDTTVTLRMPQSMVTSAKKVARKKGLKYQALMRDAIAGFLVAEGE